MAPIWGAYAVVCAASLDVGWVQKARVRAILGTQEAFWGSSKRVKAHFVPNINPEEYLCGPLISAPHNALPGWHLDEGKKWPPKQCPRDPRSIESIRASPTESPRRSPGIHQQLMGSCRYPFIHPSVHPSIHPSMHACVHPSIHLASCYMAVLIIVHAERGCSSKGSSCKVPCQLRGVSFRSSKRNCR